MDLVCNEGAASSCRTLYCTTLLQGTLARGHSCETLFRLLWDTLLAARSGRARCLEGTLQMCSGTRWQRNLKNGSRLVAKFSNGCSLFPAVLVPRSQTPCPSVCRGPVYHRFTRGLSPAWQRRFSHLHAFVWACFHVAMNATVTQRSKCDITMKSSRDICPTSKNASC